MKIIETFYYNNGEEDLIKYNCTVIAYGKAFTCDVHDHFNLYAYVTRKVTKRESYKFIKCVEIDENIRTYIKEA